MFLFLESSTVLLCSPTPISKNKKYAEIHYVIYQATTEYQASHVSLRLCLLNMKEMFFSNLRLTVWMQLHTASI